MQMRFVQMIGRMAIRLADYVHTLRLSRPVIEPSVEAADCGYVCISAVMALLGHRMLVDDIKALAGTTSRGLTLKQVRDALRACGAAAEVIFFDCARSESYPSNGIILLTEGHYVVTGRRRRDRIEVFDPQNGWLWMSRRRLARRCGGYGVSVDGLISGPNRADANAGRVDADRVILSLLKGRLARQALAVFALAQVIALLLPLLSMWSVDRSLGGVSVGMLGAVTIGFAALSLTNILIALVGDLAQSKTRRVAAVALSKITFDSLSSKPAHWFETATSAAIQNRVNSLSALLDFYVELLRLVGSIGITFIVGLLVLLFVSPWLLIPGLLAVGLTIALDLAFERIQRSHFAAVIETNQRRQWFTMDILTQLPVIARFGASQSAKLRYGSVTRSAEAALAHLKSLQGWQSALRTLTKSGETLLFVTIAAVFVGAGEVTVGAFVALGAYKDLLANAISSIFSTHIERRSLEAHKLQASSMLVAPGSASVASRPIQRGEVELRNVSFSYGTLDRRVLDHVNLQISPGECVVIRGPSGVGKSTIAKLLTGQLRAIEGSVEIDGTSVSSTTTGMAAVLQSDRLITGSIRDNVVYFRRDISDTQVIEALRMAAIDDFVLHLPMGLSTQVGEAMTGLSGGQRQRLLIARAALGRPKLLILDEATSSLEVEVEAAIFGELRRSGATMLLIAHRPEVWSLADRVYVLDESGRLTEEAADRHPSFSSVRGRVA